MLGARGLTNHISYFGTESYEIVTKKSNLSWLCLVYACYLPRWLGVLTNTLDDFLDQLIPYISST